MAFNPDTGLVYIPTNYSSFPFVAEAGAKMGNQLLSINVMPSTPMIHRPKLDGPGSYLSGLGSGQHEGGWKQTAGHPRPGVMTTAGNLVFQGIHR